MGARRPAPHPPITAQTAETYRASGEASSSYTVAVQRAQAERARAFISFLQRNGFLADAAPLLGEDQAVIGVHHLGVPPAGWRVYREDVRAVVPDRRTQQGRRAAEELAALPAADRRRLLPGGMPACAFSDRGLMEPRIQVCDGRLLVTWPRPLGPRDTDRLDPAVWEQARPLGGPHTAVTTQEKEAAR